MEYIHISFAIKIPHLVSFSACLFLSLSPSLSLFLSAWNPASQLFSLGYLAYIRSDFAAWILDDGNERHRWKLYVCREAVLFNAGKMSALR